MSLKFKKLILKEELTRKHMIDLELQCESKWFVPVNSSIKKKKKKPPDNL